VLSRNAFIARLRSVLGSKQLRIHTAGADLLIPGTTAIKFMRSRGRAFSAKSTLTPSWIRTSRNLYMSGGVPPEIAACR